MARFVETTYERLVFPETNAVTEHLRLLDEIENTESPEGNPLEVLIAAEEESAA